MKSADAAPLEPVDDEQAERAVCGRIPNADGAAHASKNPINALSCTILLAARYEL